MFFLGWLVVCFLVVGAINAYLRYFGLPKSRRNQGDVRATGFRSITFSTSGASVGRLLHGSVAVGGGESVHWINSILFSIYQTQNRIPEFVETWLTALTSEAEKQSKEMKVSFEGIHGSPPEFSNFRTEPASANKDFVILTTLTLKDVTLQVSTIAKCTTSANTQRVKYDVYLLSLAGQVKAAAKFSNNDLCLELEFINEPTIKIQIRPTRIDYTTDNATFDKVVRAAICRAKMRVDWSSKSTASRPSHLSFLEPNSVERGPVQRFASDNNQLPTGSSRTTPTKTSPTVNTTFRDRSPVEDPFITPSPTLPQTNQPIQSQKPQTVGVERIQDQHYQTAAAQGQLYTAQGQQYPETGQGQQQIQATAQRQQGVQGQQYQGIVQEQHPVITQGQETTITSEVLTQGPKLIVKVVKANGLVDTDFGICSAFCRVQIDSPPQDFTTNVIRNTVNPYWNEQFISDFDRRTKQVLFEVLDRDRQPGSDLIGKAVVLTDEIRRMPSSRQIIPLTGKPKSRTSTSGSVTVEFVFKDPVEYTPSTSSSSTTGLPFGFSQGSGVSQKQSSTQLTPSTSSSFGNESPNRKDEKTKTAASDYTGLYVGRSSSSTAGVSGASQLSAHNLALTSSQPVGLKSHESPTVVVTGAESQKSATLQPSKTGALDETFNQDAKKKESFASTLKRKFGRIKIKPRSQSADRMKSNSMREGSFLVPPGHGGTMQSSSSQQQQQQQSTRTAGADLDTTYDPAAATGGTDGTLRKGRSNSFSSSLRRIFRRDKKDISRENSTTKPSSSSRGAGDGSRDVLTTPNEGFDRSRRQNTPVPSDDRLSGRSSGSEFNYSSSVPVASSPLQSR